MKYIKTYEINKYTQKYKIGDVVKIKDDNTFYIIDGYDYDRDLIKNLCRIKKYSDKNKLADKEGFYIWKSERELELVSDFELAANKYNI